MIDNNSCCIRCKYLNMIRENPFTEDADYFFCHIVLLMFSRGQAGTMCCHYFKLPDRED